MLERFLNFWALNDPNVFWVLSGSILLGFTTAVIGTFAFLQKRALMGDALAHAALPGVTSAFLIFQSKASSLVLAGAVFSCILGYFFIEALTKHSKIKQDSALAIILSFFFAVGIFQLTIIQKLPVASQAGLDKILFGQSSSIVWEDLKVLLVLAAALNLFVLLMFRHLKLLVFDRQFAKSAGYKVAALEAILSLAIVLAIVTGLQLVGVVLMAALLLIPASAAKYWTYDLKKMLLLAGIFGALAGIAGANISYLAPRMPSGPWMVLVLGLIFLISVMFAPKTGIYAKNLQRAKVARRINQENVLRSLYKLCEAEQDFEKTFEYSKLISFLQMKLSVFKLSVARLTQAEFVTSTKDSLTLTSKGKEKAEELTRFHRLWETYLSNKLNLAHDHVHADAEEIEHWFNKDLEDKLLEEIGLFKRDPHGQEIPAREVDE